jgi:hypothetical protein
MTSVHAFDPSFFHERATSVREARPVELVTSRLDRSSLVAAQALFPGVSLSQIPLSSHLMLCFLIRC